MCKIKKNLIKFEKNEKEKMIEKSTKIFDEKRINLKEFLRLSSNFLKLLS